MMFPQHADLATEKQKEALQHFVVIMSEELLPIPAHLMRYISNDYVTTSCTCLTGYTNSSLYDEELDSILVSLNKSDKTYVIGDVIYCVSTSKSMRIRTQGSETQRIDPTVCM